MRTVVTLAPHHIAAYGLTVEDRTPLARMVRAGEVGVIPTDLAAAMYERAMELLGAHGYAHYEVSNYALPGFRCRHNCNYWSHEDYLGFGPSAHSFWKEGSCVSRRRDTCCAMRSAADSCRERDPWHPAPFPIRALTGRRLLA